MEYRNLEITLVSADGLKDINLVGKMDLYAVAYVAGNPTMKQKTGVDKNCGTHPRWNRKFTFMFDERSLASPPGAGLYLVVHIMAEKFGSDKDVGEVSLNVVELLRDGGEVEKMVDYKIGGKGKGTLTISYKFGEKFSQDSYNSKSGSIDQPSVAYPPNHGGYGQAGPSMPPQQGAYPMDKGYGMGGAPPMQPGYSPYPPQAPSGYPPTGYPPTGYPAYGAPSRNPGYGAPPPQGYGGYYPPPQGHYAPPPQQPHGYAGYNQKPKKKKGGMGLGMGLGAGLLGGMLLGDMMGEAGEATAYADGYDDAMSGGFDF